MKIVSKLLVYGDIYLLKFFRSTMKQGLVREERDSEFRRPYPEGGILNFSHFKIQTCVWRVVLWRAVV